MKNKISHPSFGPQRFTIPLLMTLGVLNIPASGAYEKWTSKDGRSVSMEFVRFVDKEGEQAAEFKMVNGKLATIKLSMLAEADAKRLNPDQAPKEPATTGNAATDGLSICDEAIQKLRDGKDLPAEERKKCSNAFVQYYEALSKKYETNNNTAFPEKVGTEFYINAMKMALIDPSQHGGWAFRSPLRMTILSGLKKRIEEKNEPFAIFGAIFPSLDSGDQEYAAQAMNKLIKDDQFLAKQAGRLMTKFRIKNDEDVKKYEIFIKATGIKFTRKNKAETPPNPENEEKP